MSRPPDPTLTKKTQNKRPTHTKTMKITKSLVLAAAVVGSAAVGNAQTVIDITGSTAGRAAVHSAIRTTLGGAACTFVVNTGNNLANTPKAIFKGNLGTNPVIVRTSWSGSAAGVRDVAANNASVYLPKTNIDTVALNNTTLNLANANTTNVEQGVAEIAFSDVFQSSTIYSTPVLADVTPGIIPFKFYASADAPAGITNLTAQTARQAWGTGFIRQDYLTGNPADTNDFVYFTGRDPESGTRITAMAEIGFGVFGSVQQYQPTTNATQVTDAVLWPTGTYSEGNGGFTSGGTVKAVMEKNGFVNDFGLISYLGSTDWSSTAKELAYNGNYYSSNNVVYGKYTFWGYLHQMGHQGVVGTLAPASVIKSFFTNLQTSVAADTTWLVQVAAMKVTRSSDGGLVQPLY